MGTVTGLPSADDTTVVPGDGADLVDPDLYDLTFLNTPDVSYSYAFDGNIQSLDHVLANAALMNASDVDTLSVSHARINADFPAVARNATDSPTRWPREAASARSRFCTGGGALSAALDWRPSAFQSTHIAPKPADSADGGT